MICSCDYLILLFTCLLFMSIFYVIIGCGYVYFVHEFEGLCACMCTFLSLPCSVTFLYDELSLNNNDYHTEKKYMVSKQLH